jgi:mannose-6-phosphate isomerase-like protein (cupin superfamily)
MDKLSSECRHNLSGENPDKGGITGSRPPLFGVLPSDPAPFESPAMDKVNLSEKLDRLVEYWNPRIVGKLNGQLVKLVKFQGEFLWHHHEDEDELFLVVKGRFRMEFRDRHVWLEAGEFIVVPRKVEHRPVAEEEAHILLFEPATTLNTGNVRGERTIDNPAWL